MYERSLTNKLSAAVAHEHNEAKYQLNSVVALEFSGSCTGEGLIYAYGRRICMTYVLMYHISHDFHHSQHQLVIDRHIVRSEP